MRINNFTPQNGQIFTPLTFGSRGASSFGTINTFFIGGGLVFGPLYGATSLTLIVGPRQAPGLDVADPMLASIGSVPNALVAAPASREVPLLSNGTTVKSADGAAVTIALGDSKNGSLGSGLTVDFATSAELSKKTGKVWLFYTIE